MRSKIEAILRKVCGAKIPARVEVPERAEFGHYSTNIALRLAKEKGKNPLEVAMEIVRRIESATPKNFFAKVDVAPPGFINFWLSQEALVWELAAIVKQKKAYGKSNSGGKKKIQLEFVSANPTGPLTLANGRGGFLGDVLANVLAHTGFRVEREYYINDTGKQIVTLGKSILASAKVIPWEETFYRGAYVDEWRRKNKNLVLRHQDNPLKLGQLAAKDFLTDTKRVLTKNAHIRYHRFTSEERDVQKKSFVKKALALFKKKNLAYREDGALWLKTKEFGDDKDRVIVTRDGFPTYFLSDAGHYLETKSRGFKEKILILGPDHHGYMKRIEAVSKIVGLADSEVMITQAVRLVRDGKEVKMSKRKGEFVTFEELIKEVGVDVARFFFLMIAPETHLDFDLALAKERSMKNPVYYAQYASVRSANIVKNAPAKIRNKKLNTSEIAAALRTPEDIRLMRLLARFGEIIEDAAASRHVHLLARYSLELAAAFHNFYEKERVIDPPRLAGEAGEQETLATARLTLVRACLIVFTNLFGILGISQPKRM